MTPLRHLAFIPDGNRRWAAARGAPPDTAYPEALRVATRCIAQAWDEGVSVVTLWWGSPANLTRRPPAEVGAIVGALGRWLEAEAPGLLRGEAALDVLGRWPALCPGLAPAVDRARAAAGPGPRRLCVLMAYDGRDELLDAIRAGATADDLPGRLWTGHLPPVDLVLRTGGEPHLSAGFLLWSIAEAQLAFTPTLWPDLSADELTAHLRRARATPRRGGR